MDVLPPAARRFYEIPTLPHGISSDDSENLFSYINKNVIGSNKCFQSSFGVQKVVYCDYTASGRSLSFIEEFIRDYVLPDYGNTHTTTTVTSLQTTYFRHEARDIVRNAVNASEYDAVIFTGSGSTGATHKLIHALHLHSPPVVFCGPFEHHSNLLPWRDLGADVVTIQETASGLVDVQHLKYELELWQSSGRKLIGCFSAASNVTGVLVDVNEITAVLHRHGALALWDYATAAPYVHIDMNPIVTGEEQPFVYKDAVFISTHKFVGGVQTPGVLIAKKKLFQNPKPHVSGGGTVFYVRRDAHRYLQETEMREEGGTPAIVESIRAGLVFQLKQAVGTDTIMEREHYLARKGLGLLQQTPNLVLLGPVDAPRLPVFSFLIRHPETGYFLHHNFVSALLNDLFGVQTRGGCACAGPYAQELLGIGEDLAKEIEDALVEDSRLDRVHLRRYSEYSDKEILRPGFVRFNLAYFMEEDTVDFILTAVRMVAKHGWKLLPQYTYNLETGEWRHRKQQLFKDRKWLGYVSYKGGTMSYRGPEQTPATGEEPPGSHQDCLSRAEAILTESHKVKVHLGDQSVLFTDRYGSLRWFLLPSEAYMWLTNGNQAAARHWKLAAFQPQVYPKKNVDNRHWTKCECEKSISTCPVHNNRQTKQGLADAPACGNQGKCQVDRNQDKTDLYKGDTNVDSSPSIIGLSNGLSDVVINNSGIVVENDKAKLRVTVQTHSDSITVKEKDDLLGEIQKDSTGTNSLRTMGVSECLLQEKTNSGSESKNEEKTDNEMNQIKGVNMVTHSRVTKSETPQNSGSATSVPKLWHAPPKLIFKPTIEAVEEYGMIQDGDRVLVCLSGGKDSLSLLHTMRQYQFYVANKAVHFSLGAVTVDPQTEAYDPSPLKAYLAKLRVPYFYEEQCIMESALNLPNGCASICSYCSRMKRGRIYAAARREGYNVLALGQHLDDLAESFLMSVFHNGILRTMKASYTVQEGDLRVIRPFVYVREKDLRTFSLEKKLPVIAENCPACFEAPKERHRVKQLLASQEILHPRLFHSLLPALRPIMAINKTGVNLAGILTATAGEGKDDKDIDEL